MFRYLGHLYQGLEDLALVLRSLILLDLDLPLPLVLKHFPQLDPAPLLLVILNPKVYVFVKLGLQN
jgi:hypothetical protein